MNPPPREPKTSLPEALSPEALADLAHEVIRLVGEMRAAVLLNDELLIEIARGSNGAPLTLEERTAERIRLSDAAAHARVRVHRRAGRLMLELERLGVDASGVSRVANLALYGTDDAAAREEWARVRAHLEVLRARLLLGRAVGDHLEADDHAEPADVVHLRDVKKLPFKRIATELGISEDGARKRYNREKARLANGE